jgi:hypothetical protein
MPRFMRIEVGQRACNDLHYREILGDSVVFKDREVFRVGEPSREHLPLGVSQPDERRPVDVLELALAWRNADASVAVQRVAADIGLDLDLPLGLRAGSFGCVDEPVPVVAHGRGGEAGRELITA